jgi:phage tail-like protein
VEEDGYMSDIVPSSYFALYDVPFLDAIPSDAHTLANFDNLTGGEITVEMISYDIVDENGKHSKKFIPGETDYKPVTLLRGFDAKSEALYKWFALSSDGKIKPAKMNMSVAMIDRKAGPMVIWNLFNAIPTGISGFSFNQHVGENYATFELTLQAEWIEMKFMG